MNFLCYGLLEAIIQSMPNCSVKCGAQQAAGRNARADLAGEPMLSASRSRGEGGQARELDPRQRASAQAVVDPPDIDGGGRQDVLQVGSGEPDHSACAGRARRPARRRPGRLRWKPAR